MCVDGAAGISGRQDCFSGLHCRGPRHSPRDKLVLNLDPQSALSTKQHKNVEKSRCLPVLALRHPRNKGENGGAENETAPGRRVFI